MHKQSKEEIQHNFLFMTEVQKTSDRLYEFFFNRYYYPHIKDTIFFPTFLNVSNEDFEGLRRRVRMMDKSLLNLVSCSTVADSSSHHKTESCINTRKNLREN